MEKEKKKRITLIPGPEGPIKGEDLDFKIVKEDYNVYDLEDGTILKVKTIVGKISRGIDPKTGGIYYLPDGEPLYNVRHQIAVYAEVPEELGKERKSSRE